MDRPLPSATFYTNFDHLEISVQMSATQAMMLPKQLSSVSPVHKPPTWILVTQRPNVTSHHKYCDVQSSDVTHDV